MVVFLIILLFENILCISDNERILDWCNNLNCDEMEDSKVCGIRYQNGRATHKMFDSECKLLQYGCSVDIGEAYGLTDIKNCGPTLTNSKLQNMRSLDTITSTKCVQDCPSTEDEICGIRSEGKGFVVRKFSNTCKLNKYNCEHNTKFFRTDYFACIDYKKYDQLANQNNDVNSQDKVTENSNGIGLVNIPEYRRREERLINVKTGNTVEINKPQGSVMDENIDGNIDFNKIGITQDNDQTWVSNEYPTDEETTISPDRDKIDANVDATTIEDTQTDDVAKTTNIETHETSTVKFNVNDKVNNNSNTAGKSKSKIIKQKGVVVVDAPLNYLQNINGSISNFFQSTHVFDLPIKEIPAYKNPDYRRMMIRVFGPIKVFKPWVTIPKNISEDYYHKPTLSTCYHRCPTKCPDVYAPVCGVPGIVAREPSLMFQNHCYMDAAQCKMQWDDASETAESSSYIESSFIFCLGDTMNGVFRLLPLIRTLQHMGRLKKKGKYKYHVRNLRFFNEMVVGAQPKFMGK